MSKFSDKLSQRSKNSQTAFRVDQIATRSSVKKSATVKSIKTIRSSKSVGRVVGP